MSIQISNLSFSYPDHPILENVNLSLPDKGFVVFLGQSGCGKSTFLSLLNGLLTPDKGEIFRSFSIEEQSMVFQSPLLLDYLNVKENICLPLLLKKNSEEINNSDVEKLIEKLNLKELKEKYPYQLSGGEKVRVSIARALTQGTSVLILDEPTGQLDEKNSEIIYGILKQLSIDHLIILVTHDEVNGIRLADSLYRFENKKIVPLKEEKRKVSTSISKREKSKTGKEAYHLKSALFLNFKFLKKKKRRLFFSLFFLAFDMILVYFGINLSTNLNKNLNALLKEYYSYETCSISMEEEIASEGKLHLKRKKIPSKEVISLLNLKQTYFNMEYFIPNYYEITLGKKKASINFYPVIAQKKERIGSGREIQKESEVIVNESLLTEMGLSQNNALDQVFQFQRNLVIYSKRLESTDTISFSIPFKIVGISKEKKSFNKPIVYYSYFHILEAFKEIELLNISEEIKQEFSLFDLFTSSDYNEDDFKSNSLLCSINNPENTKSLGEKYFPKKLTFSSPTLEVKESTSEILSSLLRVLTMFLALNTLTCIALLFLSIYSLYEDNIRLFALTKAFTRKKKNIKVNAYALQFLLLSAICIITVLSIVFFSVILNQIFKSLNYPSFFSLFDLRSYFFIFLLSFLCFIPSTLLPLRKIKDDEINKELEGED